MTDFVCAEDHSTVIVLLPHLLGIHAPVVQTPVSLKFPLNQSSSPKAPPGSKSDGLSWNFLFLGGRLSFFCSYVGLMTEPKTRLPSLRGPSLETLRSSIEIVPFQLAILSPYAHVSCTPLFHIIIFDYFSSHSEGSISILLHELIEAQFIVLQ
jgi:hypothetical protein